MFRIIFIVSGLLYISSEITAQEKDCITNKKTYANLSTKSSIANIPDVDSIGIKFEQKEPSTLTLFFKPSSITANDNGHKKRLYKSYDLEFEGDKYLFKKKYKNIPILPKEEIEYMSNMRKCSANYFLYATIHKDSVVYQFSQCCYIDKRLNTYIKKYKPEAVYTEDINQLVKQLEKKYDKRKHRPCGDSILIFTGFVNKDIRNNIEDVKLIEGEKSPFSDFMKQELEKSGKLWAPMLQGGRAVKSFIRIYTRLNSDGSITMSTSN